MNSKEKKTAMEQFTGLTKKVKMSDVSRVAKSLGDMNRGALVKVWDKVLELWAMVRDSEVPWQTKAIALGALVYAITPIDAIPDLIPALGLSDDVTVILAAVASLGVSLAKYSQPEERMKKALADGVIPPVTDYNTVIGQIGIIVSLLSLTASSDGEISPDEEDKALELIDYFVFSDEGYVTEGFLKKNRIRKRDIKQFIQEKFEFPLTLDEIARGAEAMNSDESLYYYAFSIAKVDDEINEGERAFLDLLAKKLEITDLEKKSIERKFNREWFEGFEPSLD